MCTTKEKGYAKRKQERTCPSCGAAAVIPGKAEYGGGWLCWRKRNGCGAKFKEDDPAIKDQPIGEIDNPDLPDLWNTCVKMAAKRARVDAVLAVTGASALFTQDVADGPLESPAESPTDPQAPVERDVQHVGGSDVPSEADPWFEEIRPLLKGLPSLGLRAAVTAAGGTVPERVGSWERVICALDPKQRQEFVKAVEQLVKSPWAMDDGQTATGTSPEGLAVDALNRVAEVAPDQLTIKETEARKP